MIQQFPSGKMSRQSITVGFIGLGRMGKPMAINVLKGGYELGVYDLRAEPVSELVKLGAKAAQSPRELAESTEILEVAVVDDAQVEEVLLGDRGAFEGAQAGTIIAIHSTVLPETVKKLAKIAPLDRQRVHMTGLWYRSLWEEERAAAGADPYVWGFKKSRAEVDKMLDYAFQQGLLSRKFQPEEMFHSSTLET
jgi:hypothetical protein